MWLPKEVVNEVNAVVRIHYIDRHMCAAWNRNRNESDLRLLTGWCWQVKGSGKYQMGLKTYTAAVRDAYYTVIVKQDAPGLASRIRRVA